MLTLIHKTLSGVGDTHMYPYSIHRQDGAEIAIYDRREDCWRRSSPSIFTNLVDFIQNAPVGDRITIQLYTYEVLTRNESEIQALLWRVPC